jgi:signal transduction histidine kinase
MEIDEVMWAPGIRWVFRVYAIVAGAMGAAVGAWGMMWLGSDLPGMPYYKASLIRVAGAVLVAMACFALAMDRVEDPDARRRGMLWFGIGHAVLFLVVLTQQETVWNSRLGDAVAAGVGVTAFAFLFIWSGADLGKERSPNEQFVSLFGTAAGGRENLRNRYQRQIREAALQEERHRLARDLHDSVKQQIFAIQTAAATAQARFDSDRSGTRAALDQVRASAREAMAEMEAMLDQLRAAPLGTTGLVEALKKQCEALGFRTGAKVDVELGALADGIALEPGAQEALFRVAQEALANIGKHARASHVRVVLWAEPEWLKLSIEDDGSGFDLAQPARGMGLSNMRARAEEFGGTFDIASSESGTRVVAAVPVQPTYRLADYNRRLLMYAGLALAHFVVALFRHDLTFGLLGLMWCVYGARVAVGRSAAKRRLEVVR